MKTTALCLDPGGTTGVALLEYDEDSYSILETRQVPNSLQGFLDFHWDELADWRFTQIICESFDLREGVYGADLSPVYIIGALEALYPKALFEIIYQKPSQKALCTDEKLKRLNLHQPARPHTNDAVRHGIIYLRNKKHPTILQQGWGG
jgi:hypothetical protein